MMLDPDVPERAKCHAEVILGDCIQLQEDLRAFERIEIQGHYRNSRARVGD